MSVQNTLDLSPGEKTAIVFFVWAKLNELPAIKQKKKTALTIDFEKMFFIKNPLIIKNKVKILFKSFASKIISHILK